MNKLLFLSLFFILFSCKNSKGNKSLGIPNLDGDQLLSISKSICPERQTLKLVESENISIGTLRSAVAFVAGTDPCALSDEINDTWSDLLGRQWFFELTFDKPLGCIANNSVWTYVTGQSADGKVEYFYSDFEKARQLRIKSDYDISASYARNHAGLRVLTCQ